MNRREEYWVLTEQLRREPPELESAVRRGMERARRRRRRPAELLAGLAGVCAAFVVMVNASPAFAISCAKVPVLRELAAAVAFSPSLRAAVEHDYVQYIGRTEGADRISVTAEYVIASPARAHLFYSVEGGGRVSWELQTPDGTPLEGYSSAQYSGTAGEAEELRHTEFHFSRGELPEEFLAVCTVEPAGPAGEAENRAPAVDGAGEPAEGEAVALTFPIQLDRDKMAGPKTVVVDTWVEADGQRLKVDQLEVYPTHTEIHLQEDPENTCWLAGGRVCLCRRERTGIRHGGRVHHCHRRGGFPLHAPLLPAEPVFPGGTGDDPLHPEAEMAGQGAGVGGHRPGRRNRLRTAGGD